MRAISFAMMLGAAMLASTAALAQDGCYYENGVKICPQSSANVETPNSQATLESVESTVSQQGAVESAQPAAAGSYSQPSYSNGGSYGSGSYGSRSAGSAGRTAYAAPAASGSAGSNAYSAPAARSSGSYGSTAYSNGSSYGSNAYSAGSYGSNAYANPPSNRPRNRANTYRSGGVARGVVRLATTPVRGLAAIRANAQQRREYRQDMRAAYGSAWRRCCD